MNYPFHFDKRLRPLVFFEAHLFYPTQTHYTFPEE